MYQSKKELMSIFKSYFDHKSEAKFKIITYDVKKNKLNIVLSFEPHKSDNIEILYSSGKISYQAFVGYL